MKNTIAGVSCILASVVCVVMITRLVSLAMLPTNTSDGAYVFGVCFLLIAGFVYLCLGMYCFNVEDKP